MKFTKTIKPGMEVSYNTDGNKVVFTDTNDDINLELHIDYFKAAISHIIEVSGMYSQNEPEELKESKELNQDTSNLTEKDEGRYIEITKPVLNIPAGTLGVIDHVFNDKELSMNDPYICTARTLVYQNVVLEDDEFKFTTVGGKSHE